MIDGLFLHFLVKELSTQIVGAKILKIFQPLREEVLLILKKQKQEYKLLINVSAFCFGIYIVQKKEINPLKPPMFCMLLRKYILGGIIKEINQEGLDRIIYIKISNEDIIKENCTYYLSVELMGRYSNLILLDENEIILGAAKLIESGNRIIKANKKYLKLIQNEKINLLKEQPNVMNEIQELENILQGISKKTREQLKKMVSTNREAVLFLDKLLREKNNPKPSIVTDKNGSKFPFFVYYKDKDDNAEEFNTFSGLLEKFWAEQLKKKSILQKVKNLRSLVDIKKRKIKKRLLAQKIYLKQCNKKDEKKKMADLLNINLHLINTGDKLLVVNDFFDEMHSKYIIPLNEKLTGLQNMQKYYKEYKKLKNSEIKLKELIKSGEEELNYLNNVSFDIEQAISDEEIKEIEQKLEKQRYISPKSQEKHTPLTSTIPVTLDLNDGWKVMVGKNSLQNEKLTFKIAQKKDLWFHAQKVPGAHVILKSKQNIKFSDIAIKQAAKIAAQNSKAKGSIIVAVDYTEVRNVRKIPNGAPGMVRCTNFKTLLVRLD